MNITSVSQKMLIILIGFLTAVFVAVGILAGCAAQPEESSVTPSPVSTQEASESTDEAAEAPLEEASDGVPTSGEENTSETSEAASESANSEEAVQASSTSQQVPTPQDQDNENAEQESAVVESEKSSSEQPSTPDNVLVVYFSNTGTTERIALDIADKLNADTFIITPEQPYTEADLNWRDENSRVSVEHADESLQDIPLVQVSPDSFSDYDIVFIGYPIWWGGASWVMNGFVEGNDFTGKTVVPFCTSMASDLGDSAENLARLSNGGTWLDGMRFSSSTTDQEVLDWVDSLDLE